MHLTGSNEKKIIQFLGNINTLKGCVIDSSLSRQQCNLNKITISLLSQIIWVTDTTCTFNVLPICQQCHAIAQRSCSYLILTLVLRCNVLLSTLYSVIHGVPRSLQQLFLSVHAILQIPVLMHLSWNNTYTCTELLKNSRNHLVTKSIFLNMMHCFLNRMDK